MPPSLYTANIVCPMDQPPVPEGGVLVDDGRVLAVGPARLLRAEAQREVVVEGVILPGLVNAHTHLELTAAAGLAVPGRFHDWLAAVAATARAWSSDQWMRSAHQGVLACLRAGVTTVGDVVARGPAVPAAARAGLLGDSWIEAVMVDREHHDAVIEGLEQALNLPSDPRRTGVSPHAPYTLGTGVLQALGDLAQRRDVPLHIHAAETNAEVLAIRDGKGPLTEGARARGYEFEWLEGGTGLTPVRYLDACGVLRAGTTIAHGVWVDEEEASILEARGVAVVTCPRSNTMLQAGAAPLERYREAGTMLALGTDSSASCPDLDVLAEARAWVHLARQRGLATWSENYSLEEQAIRLVTADGAGATGWGAHSGVLAPGRRADLVGVGIQTAPDRVFQDLVERGASRQVLTLVAGVRKSRAGE